MPDFPDLAADILAAIAARHGLGRRRFTRLASTGIVNTIYAVGDDLVLRVPARTEEGLSDTLTESVAVPVAVHAGVRTPALVVFDESYELLDVPYAIYERVHGVSLGQLAPSPAVMERVYRETGRDLARLHERAVDCPDPLARLDTPQPSDARAVLEGLIAAGRVEAAHARSIARWLDRLEPLQQAPESRKLLHDDAHPYNIMVRPETGEYLALIDWGDAGWGDPVLEFCSVPLEAMPAMLAGYREIAPLPADATAEARIVWQVAGYALERLAQPPDPLDPEPRDMHWFMGMVRSGRETLPRVWSELFAEMR